MRPWLLLGATVALEVSGSLALAAAGEHPAWYALTAVGYVGSFVLLSLVLRAGMPLGVAYGLWGATGVVLTALGGAALFDDPLTARMGVGVALIVGGVLLIEVGSQRASARGAHRALAPDAQDAP